jgi:hypothetical protein
LNGNTYSLLEIAGGFGTPDFSRSNLLISLKSSLASGLHGPKVSKEQATKV